MKIKEVADRLNISPRTIRFYEEKELVKPHKQADNQYRTFSEQDIWRLQTVIALREAGMAIDDIKRALEKVETSDPGELTSYLELQRSVMFAKWLELKQMIETADGMIHMLKRENKLPLEDIYRLAEGSKRLREQRSSWHDRWDFDRLADAHDRRTLEKEAGEYKDYNHILQLTVKWLSPVRGEQGLDLGTGTGNLAGMLMEQGAEMVGVDQSQEMLKQCRSKFPHMETKLGNFLAIPYLESRFDFIVTSFAFHHLTREQMELAIHEMRRVLKPRGRICIADLMLPDEPLADVGVAQLGYPSLSGLLELFDELGYLVKHHRVNELLHLVYAVPIR
ncbi:methyltransferase domain-containing protein [Paenibacillus hodogayensis]|uniref:Methyltransferase domain-containing protein n=1 Tax=Paenibacillus hodogayensis TaxID=279208 RepID=A0ABV5W1D3_9BACL